MKHVFTVHSPITFLAAHAVIEHESLPVNDVVILSNNYKVPFDKYAVFPFYSNLKSNWYSRLSRLNAPKNEDHYLDEILKGERFIAYVDLMSFPQAVLVTHEKCNAFNFIEEGNSSYRQGDDPDTLTWSWYRKKYSFRIIGFRQRITALVNAFRWSIRGYSQRLLAMPYSYNSYAFVNNIKYFCFSELAFPDIPTSKKVVVKLKKESSSINLLAGSVSLADTNIWVDGSNSSFTGLPEQVYHKAIDRAIVLNHDALKSQGVYIKLRPRTKDYSTNYLYNALVASGYPVQVLPDNLIIEAVFANSRNCSVFGNLSSALFYASIFGHRSFSIYSLYDEKRKTIFDDMPGYWSLVQKL